AGRERFANLGLDGAHPAALAGLIEHFGRAVRGQRVILHLNLLWMSSARHDLSGEDEFQFNHQALVPQFSPRVPCYRAEVSQRMSPVVERSVPFSAWTNHLQAIYWGSASLPAWTIEHPYERPPAAQAFKDHLLHEPGSWSARGLKKQAFAWVDLERSFQW